MKRPHDWKVNDRITAERLKTMSDAIRELQNKLSPTKRGGIGAGGFKPPFWVSTFYDTAGAAWKYRVKVGYVTYQNISEDGSANGATHYYVPTLGGTSLEADPAPTGTLPATACYVYVNFTTDAKGVINATPTITQSSSPLVSTHHIPPDPDALSGTAGDYYLLIAEFEDDGGTPGKPQVVRRITGNRYLPNQLVENANVGTGEKLYKDYDEDNDQHQWRTLVERGSPGDVQINVTPVGTDEIRIHGNNNDGSLFFEDCDGTTIFSISWSDGLITTGGGTVQVGNCGSSEVPP